MPCSSGEGVGTGQYAENRARKCLGTGGEGKYSNSGVEGVGQVRRGEKRKGYCGQVEELPLSSCQIPHVIESLSLTDVPGPFPGPQNKLPPGVPLIG